MSAALLSMPLNVMNMILKECDYIGIQSLKKVCHDLRNFVEDNNPIGIVRMGVLVFPNMISLQMEYGIKEGGDVQCVDFDYQMNPNGCSISADFEDDGVKLKLVENEDFLSVFLRDFKEVLKMGLIFELELVMRPLLPDHWTVEEREEIEGRFLNAIKELLTDKPLKAKTVVLKVTGLQQIMDFLPFVDSNHLVTIRFFKSGEQGVQLDLNEICELDHWKNAKTFQVIGFNIEGQALLNFESVQLYYQSIQDTDFAKIKDAFLTSSKMQNFVVANLTHDAAGFIIELFGVANEDEDPDDPEEPTRLWFFRIPNSDQVLSIILTSVLEFKRFDSDDIPSYYTIRD